jgi:hypothetical protein
VVRLGREYDANHPLIDIDMMPQALLPEQRDQIVELHRPSRLLATPQRGRVSRSSAERPCPRLRMEILPGSPLALRSPRRNPAPPTRLFLFSEP